MRQEIPIPTAGLSRNLAKSQQEPLTTDEAVNVRGVDPQTGRVRLSQRAGLAPLTNAPLGGVGAPVRFIDGFNYNTPQQAYVHLRPGELEVDAFPPKLEKEWAVSERVVASTVSFRENLFAITDPDVNGSGFARVRVYDSRGEELQVIRPIVVYESTGGDDASYQRYPFPGSTDPVEERARDWIQTDDSESVWFVLYEFQNNDTTNPTSVETIITGWRRDPITDEYEYAISAEIPIGHNLVRWRIYGDELWAITYERAAPNGPWSLRIFDGVLTSVGARLTARPVQPVADKTYDVVKVDDATTITTGEPNSIYGDFWVRQTNADGLGTNWVSQGSSRGYVLEWNGTDLYARALGGVVKLGLEDGSVLWEQNVGGAYQPLDRIYNMLAPVDCDYVFVSGSNGLHRLGPDGAIIWSWADGAGPDVSQGLVQIDQSTPWVACGPEYIWALDGKVRQIGFARTGTGSARSLRIVGVSGGDLYEIDECGKSTVLSAGVFDPSASLISAVELQGNAYMTDGRAYRKMDLQTGEVTLHQEELGGSMPQRGKLFASWNSRLVIAGIHDEPFNWYMSAIGNPADFNLFPDVPVQTQAVAGTTSAAGESPDVINALIPFYDDLLIFGCDHHIMRMTGDPMSGGRLDLVTDQTGMAFGEAWCKDPSGVVYFWGTTGGLYVMTAAGQMDRLSVNRIERSMQAVDLEKFRVKLVYDRKLEAVHVFFIPWDGSAVLVRHFVWEKKTGAFWEDEYCNPRRNITAAAVVDGDKPDDRRVLLGHGDGNVRLIALDAVNDDGDAIDSRVLIGPFHPPGAGNRVRYTGWEATMASDRGGLDFAVYASTEPDTRGPAATTGRFEAGLSSPKYKRVRARFMWLEIFNADPDESWSVEMLAVKPSVVGRLKRA